MALDSLPLWPLHETRILEALRRHRAPLRIMLKTRNDPTFLADWHSHHARIVGAENLIVADNMSDDPDVCDLLRTLAQRSVVFRFKEFHDEIHKRNRFAALYAALEQTCDWSILLDTDERLVWVEAHRWIADARLVARLRDLPKGAAALPGLLIENRPGAGDRFAFPTDAGALAPVLHWGKPAIASGHGVPLIGGQCHNTQFPSALFAKGLPPQLVQLHLCNLVPEQRLRANREKLAARGACAIDTPHEEIAHIDVTQETRSVIRRRVMESRRLQAVGTGERGASVVLTWTVRSPSPIWRSGGRSISFKPMVPIACDWSWARRARRPRRR